MSQSVTLAGEGVPWQVTTRAAALPFARVEVHEDPRAALDAWTELEAIAPITGYQTRRFLLPWLDTLGERRGFSAMISVARDTAGRPVALLPLGLARRGPFRVALFLGDRQSNFNLPLMRPGVQFDRAACEALLRETARKAPQRLDLFLLLNQPFAWGGAANPFASLSRRESPSFGYATTLAREGEDAASTKTSKNTRRRLRKKEQRLATFGQIAYERAATPERAGAILEAFLRQKKSRFSRAGLDPEFARPQMRAFLDRAATRGLMDGRAAFELHALCVGERIVATYGAIRHGSSLHAMFNSFDQEPDIARCSPGDLLLHRMLENARSQGVTSFDLGIGEARYKASVCEETVPLFDCIIPMTPLGYAAGLLAGLRLSAKRRIKRSPRVWGLIQKSRALAARTG
ncbi:MAG: GNAT family N-acetyltransferase [Methylobacteriaceae bacterium]|nr:GNAT family N-acetyltransferase [Methylobacteriaceae bacterium]